MKGLFFICGALFLLFLSTCKSEQDLVCTDQNTIKVSEPALDYFFFKEGTWWVYREINTNETDSVWVTRNSESRDNLYQLKADCHCGKGKCTQNIRYQIEDSAHNDKNSTGFLYGYLLGAFLAENKTDIEEVAGGSYFFPNGVRMLYDEDLRKFVSASDFQVENLDSVTLNGVVYENVLHGFYAKKSVPDWLNEGWYAPNLNLVKYTKSDGSTWELINYHIVK
jgi:hypothetical protein